MATWPSPLPALPFPVSYVPQDLRLRTQMEAGPAKLRARFTAATIDLPPFEMVLTKAQVDALETFFVTTTSGGTSTFTHDDPLLGTSSAKFRFVDRPTYTALRPNGSASERLWSGRFSLEIVP